jgi:hypothetical protein
MTEHWDQFKRSIDMLEIENAFGVAIHAAILAERERCAKVAESFIPSGFGKPFGTARDDRARTIAAKIREGSDA